MFGMQYEIITQKVKVKFSFAQKAIISLLSKVNIKSKTYFTKFGQFGMLFENMA